MPNICAWSRYGEDNALLSGMEILNYTPRQLKAQSWVYIDTNRTIVVLIWHYNFAMRYDKFCLYSFYMLHKLFQFANERVA